MSENNIVDDENMQASENNKADTMDMKDSVAGIGESYTQQHYSRTASKKMANDKLSKKVKRDNSTLIISSILIIALLLGLVCGYGVVKAKYSRSDKDLGLSSEQKALENVNILCVGCDWREGETARADVIMLVTLRVVDKKVSVLSIARDTYVEIEGHGKNKINHALAYGDMPLMKETVENWLGIDVDYTVLMNFNGFINVIDALGGIDIDVEQRMYKPTENIDLHEGPQHLNGSDALAYVRWRDDGLGDIGRIGRQQKFLNIVAQKVQNMSLTQALKVSDAVFNSIKTEMSIRQMTDYGMSFLGITPDDVSTYAMEGKDKRINGVSYWFVDEDSKKEVVDLIRYGESASAENDDSESSENNL